MSLRRSIVLAAVAALTLVGCSGDPEPILAPSKSATPTPTPTPTESETPERESAQDVATRLVVVMGEMQYTGNTSEYQRTTERCGPCHPMAETIERIYGAGGAIEGRAWQLLGTDLRGGSGRLRTYDVLVKIPPSRSRQSRKEGWVKATGGTVSFGVQVKRDGAKWFPVTLTVSSPS